MPPKRQAVQKPWMRKNCGLCGKPKSMTSPTKWRVCARCDLNAVTEVPK